jgi:hypothetical protein
MKVSHLFGASRRASVQQCEAQQTVACFQTSDHLRPILFTYRPRTKA